MTQRQRRRLLVAAWALLAIVGLGTPQIGHAHHLPQVPCDQLPTWVPCGPLGLGDPGHSGGGGG